MYDEASFGFGKKAKKILISSGGTKFEKFSISSSINLSRGVFDFHQIHSGGEYHIS